MSDQEDQGEGNQGTQQELRSPSPADELIEVPRSELTKLQDQVRALQDRASEEPWKRLRSVGMQEEVDNLHRLFRALEYDGDSRKVMA